MRRRLLWSTLAAVGVALVLLGLPLVVAVRSLLTAATFDGLQSEAEQVQVVLEQQASSVADAERILVNLAERRSERFTLLTPDGVVVIDSGPDRLPTGAVAMSPDVLEARQSPGAGFIRAAGFVAASVPARLGGEPLLLRVQASDTDLRREIREAWTAIAGLALTALAAAATLALWQGRRLARPLEALAESARRLGDGDFSARAPRSGLPEADDVATALDTTADRLGTMLQRSRSFGADASHQLRTPLTALRLDVEALAATGADAGLVDAALVETDRLEATIDELLTLAQPPAGEELVDLARLASARLDAWQALARAEGRQVVLDARPATPVRARAAAVGQSLQVLLDNALLHGDGTITVAVAEVPGPGVRLCVADDGPGFPEADVTSADGARGRGLPLARSLVEAEGGRLFVERPARGALVCLLFPAMSAATGNGAGPA